MKKLSCLVTILFFMCSIVPISVSATDEEMFINIDISREIISRSGNIGSEMSYNYYINDVPVASGECIKVSSNSFLCFKARIVEHDSFSDVGEETKTIRITPELIEKLKIGQDITIEFDVLVKESSGRYAGSYVTYRVLFLMSKANTFSSTHKVIPNIEENKMSLTIMYFLLVSMVLILFILSWIIKRKNRDISRYISRIDHEKFKAEEALNKQKNEHKNIMQNQNEMVQNGLSVLHSALTLKYGPEYLYVISGASIDDYLDPNGLPSTQGISGHRWGEKYTFYLASNRASSEKRYHKSTCFFAHSQYPINAYTIHRHKCSFTPCGVCHPELPKMDWIDKYLKYKSFYEENGVPISKICSKEDIEELPYLGSVTEDNIYTFVKQFGGTPELTLRIINLQRRVKGICPVTLQIKKDNETHSE